MLHGLFPPNFKVVILPNRMSPANLLTQTDLFKRGSEYKTPKIWIHQKKQQFQGQVFEGERHTWIPANHYISKKIFQIVIVFENSIPSSGLNKTLRYVVKTKTYLEFKTSDDIDFWTRLRKTLTQESANVKERLSYIKLNL